LSLCLVLLVLLNMLTFTASVSADESATASDVVNTHFLRISLLCRAEGPGGHPVGSLVVTPLGDVNQRVVEARYSLLGYDAFHHPPPLPAGEGKIMLLEQHVEHPGIGETWQAQRPGPPDSQRFACWNGESHGNPYENVSAEVFYVEGPSWPSESDIENHCSEVGEPRPSWCYDNFAAKLGYPTDGVGP
jgi:hypothetical protein